MKIFFLATLLLLSACVTTNKQPVVYTSSWYQDWQNAILRKCSTESQLLTFAIIDSRISAGYNVTKEDVLNLEKVLRDGCVKFYRISI
jgi:hypothetical protein